MNAELPTHLDELDIINELPRSTLIRLILQKYVDKHQGKTIFEINY